MLEAAFAAHGSTVEALAWDDHHARFDAFDAVVIGTTWDYWDRPAEFLATLRRIESETRLFNPSSLVAWNSDKRYLADLAAAGVPVVPSRFVDPGSSAVVPAGEVVVKPAIGAGSVGAQRFTDAAAAQAHMAALHADGRTALIQPYDARIEAGETALVFVAGKQSHAFTKGPLLPPAGSTPELDESGTYATEQLQPADPDFELWDVGCAALAAAAAHLGIDATDFLYARVDVIGDRDHPLLLELELVEPSLGWRLLGESERAAAQRQFALGVESALERLGLGPLSH